MPKLKNILFLTSLLTFPSTSRLNGSFWNHPNPVGSLQWEVTVGVGPVTVTKFCRLSWRHHMRLASKRHHMRLASKGYTCSHMHILPARSCTYACRYDLHINIYICYLSLSRHLCIIKTFLHIYTYIQTLCCICTYVYTLISIPKNNRYPCHSTKTHSPSVDPPSCCSSWAQLGVPSSSPGSSSSPAIFLDGWTYTGLERKLCGNPTSIIFNLLHHLSFFTRNDLFIYSYH